jgi:hypothetical protein
MVGKIYLEWDKSKELFSFFSPHIDGCHLKKHKITSPDDIPMQIIDNGGTILVYTAKKSLYIGRYCDTFSKYINRIDAIQDDNAIAIINQVEDIIGAKHRASKMVTMMRRGIVIHHGSMPLNVRHLVEKFTNLGFAKICFATSTLAQGVNMPFDLVWLDSARFIGDDEDKRLALRNLIGRAGRTQRHKTHFDIGYIVVSNPKTFSERLNADVSLSPISKIDDPNPPEDLLEQIESIRNGDFDPKYHMPSSKLDRLRSPEVGDSIALLLDSLYSGDNIMSGTTYNILPIAIKDEIKEAFHNIYAWAIGRDLNVGEKNILSTAITILLWKIQGKSFKEIVTLRHYYLTRQRDKQELKKLVTNGTITTQEYQNKLKNLAVRWSAQAYELPDSKLSDSIPPRFDIVPGVTEIDYDLLVYDTYDYLDKVISFSLSDSFCAAFEQYYEATSDYKAFDLANYFRYGSRDPLEIMLLRYGFSFEDLEIIRDHVQSIDEDGIAFKDSIFELSGHTVMELVTRYLP